MIRIRTISLPAILWLAAAMAAPLAASLAASAQTIDNGSEVRVNPIGGGGSVLLYPGGQYMRVVPQLREPGESGGPIHLHMPGKHRPRAAAATVAAAPAAPAAPRPRPAPKVAAAKPAPQKLAPQKSGPGGSPPGYSPGFDFGSVPGGAASLFQYAPGAAKANGPAQAQMARTEPAPGNTMVPGLTKQSMILFAHDAEDPAESALGNLKLLAVQLNGAMTGPAARVQIMAYGGPKGDKGSDARRLALKRALAIRQVLIDDGVPSERIDVHAMGGVDDTGPTDRVDVYTKA
jgi:outer membrane protein OmpA-like peptidoglycan-associated protein